MAADEESPGKSRPSTRRWSVGTERRVQVSESLREMFEALPQMMSRRTSGVTHLASEQTLARLGSVVLYILAWRLSSALTLSVQLLQSTACCHGCMLPCLLSGSTLGLKFLGIMSVCCPCMFHYFSCKVQRGSGHAHGIDSWHLKAFCI